MPAIPGTSHHHAPAELAHITGHSATAHAPLIAGGVVDAPSAAPTQQIVPEEDPERAANAENDDDDDDETGEALGEEDDDADDADEKDDENEHGDNDGR